MKLRAIQRRDRGLPIPWGSSVEREVALAAAWNTRDEVLDLLSVRGVPV